ncbi:MAG: hypothetical protein ACO4AZ_11205, partial [Ilumatobacteraceae bacterium]
MRPPLVISDSVEASRTGRSARRKSLDGSWRLRLVDAPTQVSASDLRGRSTSLGRKWHRVVV